jgi:hypothetical protein
MITVNDNPMMSDPLYVQHLSGRRPAVVFAFLVSVAMAGFGLYHSAPWYFMTPVGLAVMIAAAALLFNPRTGARMTADTLHFYNRKASPATRSIISMSVMNCVSSRAAHPWCCRRSAASCSVG